MLTRLLSSCGLPSGAAGDRGAAERVHGIDLELRGLHGDLVVHSVDGIEPLVGRRLAARTERDQHAIGDVSLGEAGLIGLAAIDVHLDLRRMDLLVDVNVDRAGNDGDFALDFLGDLVAGGRVTRNHLNVDGRGQAEIENLIGNIGGLEEEDFVLVPLPQRFAEHPLDLFGRTVMLLIERDKNFAVRRTDGGGVAPCQRRTTSWADRCCR